MSYHLISRRSVVTACQESQLVSAICAPAMIVMALVLGARGHYTACGIFATVAGAFAGAGFAAMRIERRVR